MVCPKTKKGAKVMFCRCLGVVNIFLRSNRCLFSVFCKFLFFTGFGHKRGGQHPKTKIRSSFFPSFYGDNRGRKTGSPGCSSCCCLSLFIVVVSLVCWSFVVLWFCGFVVLFWVVWQQQTFFFR